MHANTQSALVGLPFAHRREFPTGAFLAEAGCPANTVYLLEAGQVRCFVLSLDGCEATTAVLGPRQLVGVFGALGVRTHSLFVEALTSVRAWAMPAAPLREEMRHNPMLMGLVAGALAQRFALTEALVRDVLLLPVRERVDDMQVRLTATLGGSAPALSRAQLADLVQARPETLARVAPRRWPPPPFRDAEVRGGRSTTFRIGDLLECADPPLGHINQVVQGQLDITLVGSDSREVRAQTVRPGEFFGFSALLGLPRTAQRASALADGELCTLHFDDFLGHVCTETGALRRITRQLVRELVEMERRLAAAATGNVRQRLVSALREEFSKSQAAMVAAQVIRPSSHASLARRIGTSRESVTRNLRVLEKEGLIVRQGKRIVLRGGA